MKAVLLLKAKKRHRGNTDPSCCRKCTKPWGLIWTRLACVLQMSMSKPERQDCQGSGARHPQALRRQRFVCMCTNTTTTTVALPPENTTSNSCNRLRIASPTMPMSAWAAGRLRFLPWGCPHLQMIITTSQTCSRFEYFLNGQGHVFDIDTCLVLRGDPDLFYHAGTGEFRTGIDTQIGQRGHAFSIKFGSIKAKSVSHGYVRFWMAAAIAEWWTSSVKRKQRIETVTKKRIGLSVSSLI